jgi:cell division inhibitor SulA
MPRYVIEREIPAIGSAKHAELHDAAKKSNAVLAQMTAEKKNIQWEHTYVADNRTFCIYIADNESLIHEHAERSGFPATKITEVRNVIDPVTGEG